MHASITQSSSSATSGLMHAVRPFALRGMPQQRRPLAQSELSSQAKLGDERLASSLLAPTQCAPASAAPTHASLPAVQREEPQAIVPRVPETAAGAAPRSGGAAGALEEGA